MSVYSGCSCGEAASGAQRLMKPLTRPTSAAKVDYMVRLVRRQPRSGLAPSTARRSCVHPSQGCWRGCNGGAGVQLSCSTQSRWLSSPPVLGADVGRHENGAHGDVPTPANSERGGVTTSAPLGGAGASNGGPTGGRQRCREASSASGRTGADYSRRCGGAALRAQAPGGRRIAQASNAALEGRLGCASFGGALVVRGAWPTGHDGDAGASTNSARNAIQGSSEHLPLQGHALRDGLRAASVVAAPTGCQRSRGSSSRSGQVGEHGKQSGRHPSGCRHRLGAGLAPRSVPRLWERW